MTVELGNFIYVDSAGKRTMPVREVSSLTNPLGEPLTAKRLKLWRKQRLGAAEIGQRTAILAKSRKFFLSGGEYAGEVARFDLVCDYDPFSQESMRLLGAVDDWLKEKKAQPNSPWHDVEFDFIGVTAGIRDLDAVNQSDTFWVGVYVAVAVLVVLIFLLRRPLVSLYLIFTVVFGYLVSLGLTHFVFAWLYGSSYQGLDWKLKIFLFVILVAVGEDYNIYLVTRVYEEQRRRGTLPGLHEAVVRTGGIITSCGVIMAGTFGSMATGTLRSMIELGFAMSLGVLLDTFIIRTILVPSMLALLARWGAESRSWGEPGRRRLAALRGGRGKSRTSSKVASSQFVISWMNCTLGRPPPFGVAPAPVRYSRMYRWRSLLVGRPEVVALGQDGLGVEHLTKGLRARRRAGQPVAFALLVQQVELGIGEFRHPDGACGNLRRAAEGHEERTHVVVAAEAVAERGRGPLHGIARLVFHHRPHPVVQGLDAVPGELGVGPLPWPPCGSWGSGLRSWGWPPGSAAGRAEVLDYRQHEGRLVFRLQLHAARDLEGQHRLALFARGHPGHVHDHQLGGLV